MKLSIPQLALRIQTEADAYKFLEDLRWGDIPACPHCGSTEPYYLTPKDGVSRKTTRGPRSQRRVWKCRACRKQFSVLTGTIFHGTKIPVRTWLFVVFEMCASKNGVSAREIERKYELTPKTAWFMCHRIREAMKREPMSSLLAGRVVADETWFGGKPSNRHKNKQTKEDHRFGGTEKTPIVALVSRETSEVRSRALTKVDGTTLRSVLMAETDPASTHLTQAKPYRNDVGLSSHTLPTFVSICRALPSGGRAKVGVDGESVDTEKAGRCRGAFGDGMARAIWGGCLHPGWSQSRLRPDCQLGRPSRTSPGKDDDRMAEQSVGGPGLDVRWQPKLERDPQVPRRVTT